MSVTVLDKRRRENADLIARMRKGETLSLVAPQATWWPPRQLIEKDQAEIKRVLGECVGPIETFSSARVVGDAP